MNQPDAAPEGVPLDELMARLRQTISPRQFRPCAWYNPDGNALEVYLSPETFVAERVDTLFTVFVNPDDRSKVLGLAIKNIKAHFGPQGLSQLVLATGKASVSMLIWTAVGAALSANLKRREPAPPPNIARITSLAESIGDRAVDMENLEAVGV